MRDINPRDCSKCLSICDPAVLLRHKDLSIKEENVFDPQHLKITAVWLSLCTCCLKCVEICPENAIMVVWLWYIQSSLFMISFKQLKVNH